MGATQEYRFRIKADKSVQDLKKSLEDLEKLSGNLGQVPLGNLKSLMDLEARVDEIERKLANKIDTDNWKKYTDSVTGYISDITNGISKLREEFTKLGSSAGASSIIGALDEIINKEHETVHNLSELEEFARKKADREAAAIEKEQKNRQKLREAEAKAQAKMAETNKLEEQNAKLVEKTTESKKESLDTTQKENAALKEQSKLVDEINDKKAKSKNKSKQVDKKINETAQDIDTVIEKEGKVNITWELPDNMAEDLAQRIQKICNEVSATNPHVDVQVAFVSSYRTRKQNEILEQLDKDIADTMSKQPEEVKVQLADTIEGIRKTLYHQLRNNKPEFMFDTNIKDIGDDITNTLKRVSEAVESIPLHANVKLNHEQVQEELKSIKNLAVEIDKIDFSPSFMKALANADALLAKKEELESKQEGEVITDEETEKMRSFIDRALELKKLLKRLGDELDTVQLSASFDKNQIQDALDLIDGLSVKIDTLNLEGLDKQLTGLSGIPVYVGGQGAGQMPINIGGNMGVSSNGYEDAESSAEDLSQAEDQVIQKMNEANQELTEFVTRVDKAAASLLFNDAGENKGVLKQTRENAKLINEFVRGFREPRSGHTLLDWAMNTSMLGEGKTKIKNIGFLQNGGMYLYDKDAGKSRPTAGGLSEYARINKYRTPEEISMSLLARADDGSFKYLKKSGGLKKAGEQLVEELLNSMVMYGVNVDSKKVVEKMISKKLLYAFGDNAQANRNTLNDIQSALREKYPYYGDLLKNIATPTTPPKRQSRKRILQDENAHMSELQGDLDELVRLSHNLAKKEKEVLQDVDKTWDQLDEDSIEKGEDYKTNASRRKQKYLDAQTQMDLDISRSQIYNKLVNLSPQDYNALPSVLDAEPDLFNYWQSIGEEQQKKLLEERADALKRKFDVYFNKIAKNDKGGFSDVTANISAIDGFVDQLIKYYPQMNEGVDYSWKELKKDRHLKKADLETIQTRYQEKMLVQQSKDLAAEMYEAGSIGQLDSYLSENNKAISKTIGDIIDAVKKDKKGQIIQSKSNEELLDQLATVLTLRLRDVDLSKGKDIYGLSDQILEALRVRQDIALNTPEAKAKMAEVLGTEVKAKTKKEIKKNQQRTSAVDSGEYQRQIGLLDQEIKARKEHLDVLDKEREKLLKRKEILTHPNKYQDKLKGKTKNDIDVELESVNSQLEAIADARVQLETAKEKKRNFIKNWQLQSSQEIKAETKNLSEEIEPAISLIQNAAQQANKTITENPFVDDANKDIERLKAVEEKINEIYRLQASLNKYRELQGESAEDLTDEQILQKVFPANEATYQQTLRTLQSYEALLAEKTNLEKALKESNKQTQETFKQIPVSQLSDKFSGNVSSLFGKLKYDESGNIKGTAANKKVIDSLIGTVNKEYEKQPFNLKSLEHLVPEMGSEVVENLDDLKKLRRSLDTQAESIRYKMSQIDKEKNPDEWNNLLKQAQDLENQSNEIANQIRNPGKASQGKSENFFNSLVDMYSKQTGVAKEQLLGQMPILADNAVDGYTEEVKAKTPEVADAMTKMTEAGIEATKDAQQSHSPSYIYRQIGSWAIEGYIEGIMENIPKLKELMNKVRFDEDGLVAKGSEQAYEDVKNYVLSNGGTDIRVLRKGETTDSRYAFASTQLYQPNVLRSAYKNLPKKKNAQNKGQWREFYDMWNMMAPDPMSEGNLNQLVKTLNLGKKNAEILKAVFKMFAEEDEKAMQAVLTECQVAAKQHAQEIDAQASAVSDDIQMQLLYGQKSKNVANAQKSGRAEETKAKQQADKEARRIQKEAENQAKLIKEKTEQAIARLNSILEDSKYTSEYKSQIGAVLNADVFDLDTANGLYKDRTNVGNLLGNTNTLAKDMRTIQKLLSNMHLPDDARDGLRGLLSDMQELGERTEYSQKEVLELHHRLQELKDTTNGKSIEYSKLLQKIVDDEIKGSGSRYLPSYIASAKEWQTRVRSGDYDALAVEDFLKQSSTKGVLRGNRANLENYISKGEKMLSTNYMPIGLQEQLKSVVADMRELASQTDISQESVLQLSEAFRQVEMEAAKAGKTFFGQVGQRLKDMNAKFIAQYFSLMDIIRYFRSMISTITELDTALTEMRKVSDESLESLKEYQKTTFDTATALGTTAVQVQQSTADWMRLGESMEEAAKSAKAANILFNVSEFENINEATTALVAMSQAYKDMDKTEIIDVMNNIGNNYSIATDQLATALQASASSLMVQGNDLYEAAALVTAGNAVIQDANKVGAGLRTISLRIAGVKEGDDDIKEELEELGEEVDDWVVSTQAKKRQVILDYTKTAANGGQGVDILDSNGNLRDTYHILLDIAKVYEQIQEEDKKYGTNRAKGLVEELAGKNRSNIAASILMNPQLLEDVYNDALNSAGSAAEENAKYLDSIVGKTQQFKNELQELESNVIDSEVIKDVIDFGTTVLNLLNKIGDVLPKIITYVGALGVAIASVTKADMGLLSFDEAQAQVGFRGKDLFKTIRTQGLGGLFASDSGSFAGISRIQGLQNIYQGINFKDSQLRSIYELVGDNGNIDDVISQIGELDKETLRMVDHLKTQGVNGLTAFNQAEKITAESSKTLAKGVQLVNIAINALASVAIMFIVSKLIQGLKQLGDASEDAARAASEFRGKIKDVREELADNKEYIDEVGEEYAKLSKEVDGLGNNVSLSADEFKRYNEITEEIASRFPQMIDGYTDEGKAIIKLKDGVKELNDEYEKYQRNKLAETITDEGFGSSLVDYSEFQISNPIERLKASLTGSKKAGVALNADELEDFYETFIEMSYEESQEAFTNAQTNAQKHMRKSHWENFAWITGLDLQGDYTEEEWRAAYTNALAALDTIEQERNSKLVGIRDEAQTYFEYALVVDDKQINENNKKAISSIVNSIDEDVANSFGYTQKIKENQTGIAEIDALVGLVTKNKNKKKQIEDMEIYVDFVTSTTGDLDSDALGILFGEKNPDVNYKETEDELLKAYGKLQKDLDKRIAETTDEREKEWLKGMKQSLWTKSGAEAYLQQGENLSWSIHNVAANQQDRQYLHDYTKDFTATQIQAWLNVVDAEMSATEAVRAYEAELERIQYYKFDNIGSLLSSGGNATNKKSWADIKEDLVGLAQVGKLDENTIKEYEYYNTILEALGMSAEDADEALSGMVNTINEMAQQNAVDVLNAYKNGIDNLNDAYQKFKNGELIDASTLSGIQDAFGDLPTAYEEFENAVMTGVKDLQPYFDNIATEYAIEKVTLGELTEETKDWYKQNLIAAGITEESAEKSIDAALKHKESIEKEIRATLELMNAEVSEKKGRDDLAVSTANLDALTAEEIVHLMQEADMSGKSAQAVAAFALKKELAKDASLRNQDDINYLMQLITLAGIGGKKVSELKYKLENQQNYEKAKADAEQKQKEFEKMWGTDQTKWGTGARESWKGVQQAWDNADAALKSIDTLSEEVIQEINDQFDLGYDLDLDLDYGGIVDSAGNAGEDAAAKFKEMLDKILAMYDAELDAGVVSFQTYVDKSRAIIQQYYNDGKIKASEYYDYLANLYEKQVSEYDKVISAVQRKLKEQTDELEKQKEAIEESYNAQIEEIQAKIDALQDENDEIEKNIALQKAQYELARARNQRTKLMYSESRGFYYEADLKGIQDAQENVRKAQLDKTVSDLQKKITTLQDAMKKETDVIDAQIKKLNEYAEQWGEVSSKLQNAIEDQRAAEILGSDWEKQILDMRIDTLKNFTDQYIALQQAQKDAYLEARRAELGEGETPTSGAKNTVTSNPNGNGGGGDGGTRYTSGFNTTGHSQQGTPIATTGHAINKTAKTKYNFNGKTYETSAEATQAKNDYVKSVGQQAYDNTYKSVYSSTKGPDSAKYATAKQKAEEARKKAEENAKKSPISTVKSYFEGSEFAKAGNALVGELGSEIVLDKNSGTASIVEEPTIMKMKGGEKVFNAEETEKILKSKYVPLKQFNPKKFAMLHAFANGTSSPMQSMIAAQAVGIANGINNGWIPATATGGTTVNQTFNVSLPNITDASKANDLFKEFEQLQRKATQFFNK